MIFVLPLMGIRGFNFLTRLKLKKMNKIRLFHNNDKRDWSDKEWVEEFFNFLMGEIPEGIRIARGHQPKMSAKKAETIIWYLQQHFPIIPDNIERCAECDRIFDFYSEGEYFEKTGKVKCNNCL